MVHLTVRQCPYLCRVVQREHASPVKIRQDCFAPCWVERMLTVVVSPRHS